MKYILKSIESLIKSGFFKADPELNKLIIMHELKTENTSVRSISRTSGLSVGSVSQYIQNLIHDGFVTSENLLTSKGEKYYHKTFNNLQSFLLNASDLIIEEFGSRTIKIAAVACKSSFLIERIDRIFRRTLEFQYFSTAYEVFTKCKDVNLFVIGSVPAVKLMSFGAKIKPLSDLSNEKHAIIGNKGKSDCLIVIGEDSVSSSLVKNAKIFGINLGYKKVKYIDSIEAAMNLLKASYDVLLWEPFLDYALSNLKVTEKYLFPSHNYSTQVLIKNEEQYLENRIEEAFIIEAKKAISDQNDEYLLNRAKQFLGR